MALSPDIAEGIVKFEVPAEKITVITNSCDNDLFAKTSSRVNVRKKLGWNDLFICIHPGAMGEVNGLNYLIEVGKILDKIEVRDVRIVLLGDGSQKERLQKRIKRENIHTVKIMDSIPKYLIAELLTASDLGIVCVAPIPILAYNSANKLFDFFSNSL